MEHLVHPEVFSLPQNVFKSKECDPECVRDAAGNQKSECHDGHVLNEQGESDCNEPTHDHIEGNGYKWRNTQPKQFDYDSDNRNPPNDPEQRPAPSPRKHDKGNRGVGGCDENINHGMIEPLGYMLETRHAPWNHVVECACEIKQNKTGAIQGVANNMPRPTPLGSKDNKHYEHGDCQRRANKMQTTAYEIIRSVSFWGFIHNQ